MGALPKELAAHGPPAIPPPPAPPPPPPAVRAGLEQAASERGRSLEAANTGEDAQLLVGAPEDELPRAEAEPTRHEALVQRERALVGDHLPPAIYRAGVGHRAVGERGLAHDARLGHVGGRRAERGDETGADGGAQVAEQVVARVHDDVLLGGVVRGELAQVDECSALDRGRAARVEAGHALLRLDLGEGVGEAGVPRRLHLARGDEAAVVLHAHLDEVARHGDRLADGAGAHARGHLGGERRLVLRRAAAEERADVLVADRAEARVRDVPSDRGRDAGVQAEQAFVLEDVHGHAAEA
mmetsp:Transcript_26805/g.67993  ORF Transcript_26805/g.67993 Transcript_26805/m.67993 type:complete len:298 (-) Transcript_26805:200-1093(-)